MKKDVDNKIPSLDVVEIYKKTPVNEPGSLLQHLHIVCKLIVIDEFTKLVQIVKSTVPILD